MTCLDFAPNKGWVQDPSPLLPSPGPVSWSLPWGGPSPLGGVAGCSAPTLLLTLWASLPCLVCKRTLDEAPLQLESTRLSVSIQRPPPAPTAKSSDSPGSCRHPSLHPSLAQFSFSLFLIPFPRMSSSGLSLKTWRKSGAGMDICPPVWTVEGQWP